MKKKILLMLTNFPQDGVNAFEAILFAMAGTTFLHEFTLFFRKHALFSLLKNQHTSASQTHTFSALLPSLKLYDIEQCVVLHEDLQFYQLSNEDLIIPTEAIHLKEVNSFMGQFDEVIEL